MIDPSEPAPARADELRELFDSSFAVAPETSLTAVLVDLLAIRVGEARYAIRLSEISGIFAGTTTERVPSHHPQLMGMATFRGVFLPVFDLGMILGHKVGEPARWTLLVGTPARLGLAFVQFDGHLRVAEDAIASPHGPQAASAHMSEIVETGTGIVPVIHLPSVLATIEQQTTAGATKEH